MEERVIHILVSPEFALTLFLNAAGANPSPRAGYRVYISRSDVKTLPDPPQFP